MAYSMFEERHMKNLRHVQYTPEESEVPEQSDYSETKFYYSPPRIKKFNKIIPEVHYMNDRRCPIYVHEYNKTPSDSTYNNHSSKSFGKTTAAKSQSSNSQSSKSMLDKLEETYWATWKPSRDKHARSPRRNTSKNKAYGDTSDTLVKYFEKSNFKSSSASVDDTTYKYGPRAFQSTRFIETSTQEIQTEDLTTVDESVDQRDDNEIEGNEENEIKLSETETTLKENVETSTDIVNINETDMVPVKENEQQTEDETNKGISKSKLLEHKDSFIIHKKKQDEVKESFQQPRCIKLFKKTGSTYLRGGTYPLKSCLRNDSTPKGHFRLGPPGSPMFVTSNSFNRKYGK